MHALLREDAREMSAELETNLTPEIGHILFVDVVGYSKLLINEQIALIHQLNHVVRETASFRAAEASGKLIRLTAGDGIVLVFFQSPEEPLRCAVEIATALRALPHIRVRMGAHSGPINQIKDLNGELNVAGAGINMAQRVMDCGDAGHILLSKRLSDDLIVYRHWQPYLHDLGECTVKHGVKLSLVNFWNEAIGNSELPEKLKDACAAPPPASFWQQRRTQVWLGVFCVAALVAFIAVPLLVRQRQPPPAKSVAVLPFDSLSDERRPTDFADGMLEQILTDLSKVADLKVISHTSVMKFREPGKLNLRQIANALDVRYVVEGSVQRAGDNVRVFAQLIDAANDSHIWADSYDRHVSDIFAIQSDIAEKIVAQLQAKLTPEEKAAMEVRPTNDLKAYDLYLQAQATIDRVIYDSNQIENLLGAEKLLEQATARDPKFFLAFCKLAYVHDQIYFNSLDHTPERLSAAQRALDQAQQLQPDSGEFHLAAAAHYYFGYLEYDRARQELVIARQKMPNDPYPILLLGYIDRRQGRWDESTKELERTLDLDPRNLLFLRQLSLSYNMLRRYKEMADLLDRAIILAPNDPNFLIQRAMADLDWRADTKPLHAVIDRILKQNPAQASVVADQWMTLALCEADSQASENALRAMSEKGCEQDVFPYPRAWCEGLAARQRNDMSAAHGFFVQAKSEVTRITQAEPNFAAGLSVLGMIDAALDNQQAAIQEGEKAVLLLPVSKDAIAGPLYLQNLAVIYAWTGKKDAAFAKLDQLVAMPCYLSYGQLRLHPYWQPLREDARLERITAALSPKE